MPLTSCASKNHVILPAKPSILQAMTRAYVKGADYKEQVGVILQRSLQRLPTVGHREATGGVRPRGQRGRDPREGARRRLRHRRERGLLRPARARSMGTRRGAPRHRKGPNEGSRKGGAGEVRPR